MSDKPTPPYTAILPTILCQQPAVILHWLNEQRATGNLPVEIVLDVLIELASRTSIDTLKHSFFAGQLKESLSTYDESEKIASLVAQLEVYKRAVKELYAYIRQYENQLPALDTSFVHALAAVDKLEGGE